jgi:hypothetical protein
MKKKSEIKSKTQSAKEKARRFIAGIESIAIDLGKPSDATDWVKKYSRGI